MNMKTHFTKSKVLAAIGVLFLIGCTGGTGEGNPEFGYLSVSIKAKTGIGAAQAPIIVSPQSLAKAAVNDTLNLRDAENTPYTIQHIYSHIDQIEFTRPKEAKCISTDTVYCTDSTVIISGSRYVDLLENPSAAILKDFPLSLGVYNQMKVRFSTVVDSGDGSIPSEYRPLLGHAILMKGSFAYKGVSNRGLAIFLDFNEPIVFENAGGLAITTDSPYNWAGVFQANGWLNNLEITDCLEENLIPLGPDGELVIDSTSTCNEVEDSLFENVKHSTSFELDHK